MGTGYALSPLDLIPDFVPVLGYGDDIILILLGIALVIKLMPGAALEYCRLEAARYPLIIRPPSWLAAFIIATLWLLASSRFFNE